MDRIAVCRDRCVTYHAVLVAVIVRFFDWLCSSPNSFVKRVVRVLNQERDIVHAIAVLLDVFGSRMLRRQRRCQNKIDPILPQSIARHLTVAGLQPHISRPRKPESLAIIKLRLLSVPYVKFNVM